MNSETDGQRQGNVNRLVLLKADLADIEADLQGAIADSARQRLQKEAQRILHEIRQLESRLG
ncbi:MAG: hypothetical protein ACFB0C_22935 [Leptolyngbyaceae cyanobacterium]